jgi:hypothetical protein
MVQMIQMFDIRFIYAPKINSTDSKDLHKCDESRITSESESHAVPVCLKSMLIN